MDLLKATKKSLSAFLLAGLALPLAAVPAGEPAAAKRACEVLQQWVVDHRAALPTDYAGILAYSPEERRAIFANLSPEQKTQVWRERLDAYLAQHPSLTAEQQSAFALASQLLRPEFFEKTFKTDAAKAQQNKELDALGKKLARMAGGAVAREAFFDLGSAAGGRAVAEGETGLSETCQCRQYWDCPPTATACGSVLGEPPCWPVSGCGIFYNQDCTGICLVWDP